MTKKSKSKPSMNYSDLSKSTKERYSTMLKEIHTSGYKASDIRKMDVKQFKQAIGKPSLKNATAKAYIRVINQMSKSTEVRKGTLKITETKYQKFGYRGKKLIDVKNELIRTIGGAFDSIVDFEQKHRNLSKKDAENYSKEILLLPKNKRHVLDKPEQEILDDLSP